MLTKYDVKNLLPLLLILLCSPALAAGLLPRTRNPEPLRTRAPQTVTGVRGDVMFLSEEISRGGNDSRSVEPRIRISPPWPEARPRFYLPADTNVSVEFNKFSVQLYALPGFSGFFFNKDRPVSDSVMAHDLDGAMTALNKILFSINDGNDSKDGKSPDPAWNVMTVTLGALAEKENPIAAFAGAADVLEQSGKNRQACLDSPALLLASINRAAFLEAIGQYDEAADAFKIAIACNASAIPGAWRRLGLLQSLAGDSQAARTSLMAALKSDTEDAEAWLLLGALQLGASENKNAEESLDRVLDLANECVDAHVLKARLYSSLMNHSAALLEMDVAIRLAEEQSYPDWYRRMLERTRHRYRALAYFLIR